MDKINLLNFDYEGLKGFFQELGEKPFRADQVYKWIYQRGVTSIDQMTDLSKDLRTKLLELTQIRLPNIVTEEVSSDGTRKWLVEVNPNNKVETVFIPEGQRGTLCVSSQVGCALNCSFCATATQGFNSNLTTGQIIGQMVLATQKLVEANVKDKITNVVMMGMGEPLLNFDNVVKAMSIMRDDRAFGLSKKRVTLSTSGVVPNIYELARVTDVALAVSLHAPNDELREQLVPINKKYPIKELLKACKEYCKLKNKMKITMEYVMLKGVNDKLEHAHQLAKILANVPCKINLIPFNPYKGATYERSTDKDIEAFRQVLINKGYFTMARKTRGDDIKAACGQLVGNIKDRTKRNQRFVQKLEIRRHNVQERIGA